MAWNDYGKPKVTLPVHHCEKDAQWLREQLLNIHQAHRITACVGYSDAYLEGYNSTDIQHKKENCARRNANIRMRKFVAKCKQAAQDALKPAQQFKRPESGFNIDSL